MGFLDNKGEALNEVLAGYFYKIFNHFMNQKGIHLIPYILNGSDDKITLFIDNIASRSIIDCIIKLLTSTNTTYEVNMSKTLIIKKLIKVLAESDNEESVENTSDLLIELLGNRTFYRRLKSDIELVEQLYLIIRTRADNQCVIKQVLRILIKTNENILKDYGNIVTTTLQAENDRTIYNLIMNNNNGAEEESKEPSDSASVEKLFGILSESVNDVIASYIKPTEAEFIDTTYGENRKALGPLKLLEIEYIKSILDIIINGYANNVLTERFENNLNTILDSEMFQLSIANFFEFEFNNIYQNIFQQVIVILVNKYTPKIIIDHLFKDLNLMGVLIDNCEKNLNFKFQK
jgi:hypothetical protein